MEQISIFGFLRCFGPYWHDILPRGFKKAQVQAFEVKMSHIFNIWLKLRFLGLCKVSTIVTCRNKVQKCIPNPSSQNGVVCLK